MQNYIEQRAVDLQSAFRSAGVVNEAQLPESVHKEADTGARGPNHLGQRFLADLRDNGFGDAFLAKMCEQ